MCTTNRDFIMCISIILFISLKASYDHVLLLSIMSSIYWVFWHLIMLFASTVLNYSIRIHTFLRRDYFLSILGKIWSSTNLFTHEHILSLCLNYWFNGAIVFKQWMFFWDVVGPIHVTHWGNAGKLSYRAVDFFLSDYIN